MCTMWLLDNQPSSFVENTFHSLFGYTHLSDYKARFATITYVRDNVLLTPDVKNEIFDVFALYQRNLFLLNNIVRRFRYSRMKYGGDDCDLVGNVMSEVPNHLKITIAHVGIKYTFRISDLINIINKSLTYREDLFLLIQPVKNPYTNIPFTRANLFQIYMHIKKNTDITMPVLFHLFYTTTFDKNEFSNKYEAIALDHSIQNYIDDYEQSELVDLAYDWIKRFKQSNHKEYKNLYVDKNYSKIKLVKQLKPMLKQYLISSYTLTASVKYSAHTKANNLMVSFLEKNKDFGRCSESTDIKQIVFKNLAHMNTYSFDKNNEYHISVIDAFIKGYDGTQQFNYPNITPFNDNIFIIRNYVNVSIANRTEPNPRTRRRLQYDNQSDELSASNMAIFLNNLPQQPSSIAGRATGIALHPPPENHPDDDSIGDYEDISYDSF
uniref:Uncharacterized protein n=1 Tax=viral metagenome TaxID=1070528 RepID=A0A6C0BW38_9ZZZZ